MGLTTATERAIYNYLEKQVDEAEALAWTKGIFSHPDIAEVMLSPIWKNRQISITKSKRQYVLFYVVLVVGI